MTQGRRVTPNDRGHLMMQPGDYGKDADGDWWARPPGGDVSMGCLTRHEVTEHDDGTITVSPSIEITQPPKGDWHGYLERGGWREV